MAEPPGRQWRRDSTAPFKTNNEEAKRKASSFRPLFIILGLVLISSLIYDGKVAIEEEKVVEDHQTKKQVTSKVSLRETSNAGTPAQSPIIQNPTAISDGDSREGSDIAKEEIVQDSQAKTPKAADLIDIIVTEAPEETVEVKTGTESSENEQESQAFDQSETDGSCTDFCVDHETLRKNKFGGDLLDPKDVLRLAKGGKAKTIEKLKEFYGEYFESIFVKPPSNETNYGEPSYFGMKETTTNGPSRQRLKRKLKLKVLKMMDSVRSSEINVLGCNCMTKEGKLNESQGESADEIPDFYEKYVFANGGHSQAAGHGNKFNESYTAYMGEDLRPIWEAIGIEMIDRNYAMGAMRAMQHIAPCNKEVFGSDVDFLAWNYGMTDGRIPSYIYYMYRGAMNPGRPALVTVDGEKNFRRSGSEFEEKGLAFFAVFHGDLIASIPDSSPDGIPLTDEELRKLPEGVNSLKCNGRYETKGLICSGAKWSCTDKVLENGIHCDCPHVGKRTGWHMGYRMHALVGHMLGLPLIEILIEGLHEIAESEKGSELMLQELEAEEDREFEKLLASPLMDELWKIENYRPLGLPNSTLMDTWFRGPSICRTSLLPAESRFLGMTTNTNKTGSNAIFQQETYDTGDFITTNRGPYKFLEDKMPPAGVFSILSDVKERAGWQNVTSWGGVCKSLIMPDYKDWFFAPLDEDNKAVFTFPNEKEKAYYRYNPNTFKGILCLVLPIEIEKVCHSCHPRDMEIKDFQSDNVTITVNGKKVGNIRVALGIMILENESGSIFWEPSSNEDYVIGFNVVGHAAAYHLRLENVFLY